MIPRWQFEKLQLVGNIRVRAWIFNGLLTIYTDLVAWTFTVEAVYLIHAHSTLTSGVSFKSALVNVDLTSFAAEAFLTDTSEQIAAVDHALAIVETIASWAFGRLEAFWHTMTQVLIEIGAH